MRTFQSSNRLLCVCVSERINFLRLVLLSFTHAAARIIRLFTVDRCYLKSSCSVECAVCRCRLCNSTLTETSLRQKKKRKKTHVVSSFCIFRTTMKELIRLFWSPQTMWSLHLTFSRIQWKSGTGPHKQLVQHLQKKIIFKNSLTADCWWING